MVAALAKRFSDNYHYRAKHPATVRTSITKQIIPSPS